MNSNMFFLLGAKDPEMIGIEEILTELNLEFEYATVSGVQCNPTNAYQADNILPKGKNYVFIECRHIVKSGISIDHHNENDYGYSLNYSKFLDASSIGQLFKFLVKNNIAEAKENLALSITYEIDSAEDDFYFLDNQWLLNIDNYAIIIPEHIVTMSAIDHCLSDAYKGLCLGVNSKNIFREQVNGIGKKFNLDKKSLSYKIKQYNYYLKNNNTSNIIDLTDINLGIGYSLDYLLLRELSLYSNKSIAIKTKNDKFEENYKLMLIGLSYIQVSNFLKESKYESFNLSNVFGVPARGYAGGIIKR